MIQPALPLPSELEVQTAHLQTLANGVRLYTLPTDDFEVLRITFVFRAGSTAQQVPFSASATANLLAEGSQRLTAHEIAERLDYYGSWFDVNLDRDHAYISFATLSKFYRQTLEVAEEILLRPIFPEEELLTYCTKRQQRLKIERQRVEVKAREAFARALFGPSHPYGTSFDEKLYDTLTREQIEAFYRTRYTAENCFVVCSGRIGDDERRAIAAIAEALPHGTAAAPQFPTPTIRHEERIAHPGAVQSALRVGRLLFDRRHPDFVGMQVVAAVLGGYFGSRLMRNLREIHGYTYGVVAAMVNFEQAGYLAIATQVGAEATNQALAEIYAEIERLRTELMPDEELALVKRIMAGEMLRILDGPFGIADVTIENILCNEDNTVVSKNLRHIEALTPSDIQQLAQRYLAHEDLVTVVVGAL